MRKNSRPYRRLSDRLTVQARSISSGEIVGAKINSGVVPNKIRLEDNDGRTLFHVGRSVMGCDHVVGE